MHKFALDIVSSWNFYLSKIDLDISKIFPAFNESPLDSNHIFSLSLWYEPFATACFLSPPLDDFNVNLFATHHLNTAELYKRIHIYVCHKHMYASEWHWSIEYLWETNDEWSIEIAWDKCQAYWVCVNIYVGARCVCWKNHKTHT